MSEPSDPSPTIAIDDSGVIRGDAPCRDCGYNLRGLTADGRCPECGAAVAMSLTDDHLAQADPAYVRKLTWGSSVLLIGVGLELLFIALRVLSSPFPRILPYRFLGFPGVPGIVFDVWRWSFLGAIAWGTWLVTTPDVVSPRTGRRHRWIARMSSVAILLVEFLPNIALLPGSSATELIAMAILDLAMAAVTILAVFCLLSYLVTLSRRIPDASLGRSSNRVRWTHMAVTAVSRVCLMVFSVILLHRHAAGVKGSVDRVFWWSYWVRAMLMGLVTAWLWLVVRRYRRHFKRLAHAAAGNAYRDQPPREE